MEENIKEIENIKQNSIEIKKGVKGYTWNIKVYFDDVNEGIITTNEIKKIDNQIKLLFEEV